MIICLLIDGRWFMELRDGISVATETSVQTSRVGVNNKMKLPVMFSSQLKCLAAAFVITVLCSLTIVAQQPLSPPKAEIRFTAGGAGFNDGEVPHGVVGGSVRLYVTRRLSVEPEFLYMYYSENDQDFIVQPNLAYDFREPTKKVVPYVIGGVGVLHHRARYSGFDFTTGAPRTFDFSSTGWTVSAGAGVKIFVTDRIFIAPEARLGWEPTVRGTISVGYVFSGRE